MSGDRSEEDTIEEVRYSSLPEVEEKEPHKILQQKEVSGLETKKHLEESRKTL